MKTSAHPPAPETAAPPQAENPQAENPQAKNPQAEEKRPWALHALPPFPAVALQLMSLLDDNEAPIKKVVSLLSIDPVLTAEILRVANSALYGLSRRIDNVSHAVVVLGAEVVKRLALTVALGRFSRKFMRVHGLRVCWDHSVACALVAEELAQAMNQPKDRAYTAGLLHDIGRLALLTCYPVEYNTLFVVARENQFDELECEWELFDIDHCAAGAWLARHWNLPEDFVEAISAHHRAEPADASLVSIVTAAHHVANRIGFHVLDTVPPQSVEEILAKLPLADRAATAAKLEGFADSIRGTIATVTPAARQGSPVTGQGRPVIKQGSPTARKS
jgi:putative nucleotidyltransferase with HDIG domain